MTGPGPGIGPVTGFGGVPPAVRVVIGGCPRRSVRPAAREGSEAAARRFASDACRHHEGGERRPWEIRTRVYFGDHAKLSRLNVQA
ncbi:hypothetical protein GCM10010466_15220 [Planomonospora alba]|uniref:Uncharacterized protein n=1 Tax=Planomonospora alba TaxID=161354 RepID=A0ABP6MT82_9ACTN